MKYYFVSYSSRTFFRFQTGCCHIAYRDDDGDLFNVKNTIKYLNKELNKTNISILYYKEK